MHFIKITPEKEKKVDEPMRSCCNSADTNRMRISVWVRENENGNKGSDSGHFRIEI